MSGCDGGHLWHLGRCVRDACGSRLAARSLAHGGLEAAQQAASVLPDGALQAIRSECLEALPRARSVAARAYVADGSRERVEHDLAQVELALDVVRIELKVRGLQPERNSTSVA